MSTRGVAAGWRRGQDEGATNPRAVFLDRDGRPGGNGYFRHHDEFTLYPEAPAAIRLLNDAGLKAIVVTNQWRIGAGRISRGGGRAVAERAGSRTLHRGARNRGAKSWRASEDR